MLHGNENDEFRITLIVVLFFSCLIIIRQILGVSLHCAMFLICGILNFLVKARNPWLLRSLWIRHVNENPPQVYEEIFNTQ
jgi:hypothetical protein